MWDPHPLFSCAPDKHVAYCAPKVAATIQMWANRDLPPVSTESIVDIGNPNGGPPKMLCPLNRILNIGGIATPHITPIGGNMPLNMGPNAS